MNTFVQSLEHLCSTTIIFIDKTPAKPIKDKSTNQKMSKIVDKAPIKERTVSGSVTPSSLYSSTSKIPQLKVDATDRRQIEAVNEDKYNSTKETLDDIRCVHLKEKKKKEQKDGEKDQPGAISERSVSTDLKLKLVQNFK